MFFCLIIIIIKHIFDLVKISCAVDCLQGAYQVAKWNGTRVSVKILDKDNYADPERMYSFILLLSISE